MPYNAQLVSPLRYPGSKALLTEYIAGLLEENNLQGCTFVEPYAGSAIVSFLLVFNDLVQDAVIVERDPLIYAFWDSVLNNTEELINKIDALPVTIDTWHAFQKYRDADDLNNFPVIDLGLAGLFFNRTNYSGILKAGPLGGRSQSSQYKIDCRFNKDRIIKQIERFSLLQSRVTVIFDDALSFLKDNELVIASKLSFLYIDPPYFKEGKNIYRYWYTMEDHIALADYLSSLGVPWLVSYDDNPIVRELYTDRATVRQTYFDYAAGRPRQAPELLISNRRIPPRVVASAGIESRIAINL